MAGSLRRRPYAERQFLIRPLRAAFFFFLVFSASAFLLVFFAIYLARDFTKENLAAKRRKIFDKTHVFGPVLPFVSVTAFAVRFEPKNTPPVLSGSIGRLCRGGLFNKSTGKLAATCVVVYAKAEYVSVAGLSAAFAWIVAAEIG